MRYPFCFKSENSIPGHEIIFGFTRFCINNEISKKSEYLHLSILFLSHYYNNCLQNLHKALIRQYRSSFWGCISSLLSSLFLINYFHNIYSTPRSIPYHSHRGVQFPQIKGIRQSKVVTVIEIFVPKLNNLGGELNYMPLCCCYFLTSLLNSSKVLPEHLSVLG